MPLLKRAGAPDINYVLDDYTDPWRNAPYLILQHGSGRSSRFWYSWVPYLSRFYKVVRPDVRGLGGSSADFDFSQGAAAVSRGVRRASAAFHLAARRQRLPRKLIEGI